MKHARDPQLDPPAPMLDLSPVPFDTEEAADLYDELPLWSAPFGLWLLDRAPLKPDLTVLDLGAGTGFLSVELAERCGPGSRVIAVDTWGAALQRLARKLAQRGLHQVQLLQQDAAKLDLPAASVDVIVSNLGVNNFDDPPAVMRVCARLARPGAALLLTSNLVGHMAEFYEVFDEVLRATGQAAQLPALQAHMAHRATPAGVQQLLEDAGFEVTEQAESSFRLRYADGSALLRHFFIRLGFLPAWKALASPGREAETFAALEQALNERAARLGELALTVPMAGFVARRRAAA